MKRSKRRNSSEGCSHSIILTIIDFQVWSELEWAACLFFESLRWDWRLIWWDGSQIINGLNLVVHWFRRCSSTLKVFDFSVKINYSNKCWIVSMSLIRCVTFWSVHESITDNWHSTSGCRMLNLFLRGIDWRIPWLTDTLNSSGRWVNIVKGWSEY